MGTTGTMMNTTTTVAAARSVRAEDGTTDRAEAGQRALRRADRQLDALRDEADHLDAMILYLQRRRDAVEDQWCEALAQRDAQERELWEHAQRRRTEREPATVPATVDARAQRYLAANGRPNPPDLRGRSIPRRAAATSLLDAWGLAGETTPVPPVMAGRSAPTPAMMGPLLQSWELEEAAPPEPVFIPVARTHRISVVPTAGRVRRRNPVRGSQGAPRVPVVDDTAPIWIATRHADGRSGRGTRRPR